MEHAPEAVTLATYLGRPGPPADTAGDLVEVLRACVAGGASVSFMAGLDRPTAAAYWSEVFEAVRAGRRALVLASLRGSVVGTVQLELDSPPNQPHRADVAKLLVAPGFRGRGLGMLLMDRVEEVAAGAGRSLLVLDTAAGSDAERLYGRLGWQRTGEIPDFALMPDGTPCATVIFWKRIGRGTRHTGD
jgi:GNAT superfamily N-acetyltransferase